MYQGDTATTAVAPEFSDSLNLFKPGWQILPTIGAVAPKIAPLLRPWSGIANYNNLLLKAGSEKVQKRFRSTLLACLPLLVHLQSNLLKMYFK